MSYEKHLNNLQDRIGYQFDDRSLLERSLVHSSFGDGRRKMKNNERLEFLGDRVLGLLTAEALFSASGEQEGVLARKLNALVRKETCAEVAKELKLGDLVRLSKSTEKLGGREKTSILGDAAEALLAALYLDGGYDAARTFYDKYWTDKIDAVLNQSTKDPKTELQERAARDKVATPEYEVTDISGPDHRPEFNVIVSVSGKGIGTGQGGNKKEAERAAASDLLKKWNAS